ncbi:MAG: XdhC family protein [Sphaerochaetaceae bacterium]|nr:XdhC family protein [Sphaerochaetaceae bacterium]
MDNYYDRFLEALQEGDLERRTDFCTGHEAIYRNGKLLCADADDPIETPSLVEEIKAEPHLVMFGCGHVGKALYDLAVLQNWKITILDCREELLTEASFPKATRIVGPYEELLAHDYSDFLAPYYCIFTHGHTYDEDSLLYALRHKHSYIGMIGSKAKVAHCMQSIRDKGITDDMLCKLHTPIGLSINAVTPQEIAVAIMAQMISVFRTSKKVITLDAKVLKMASQESGIMARIISQEGSAPRSVGSMIFVTEHDILGTVGGGAVEEHTINTAREMLKTGKDFLIEHHILTSKQPLEMTCGGEVSVMYKKVN